ncbi:MAG: hypothetical protein KDA61_03765, partial [Planctomycetales bacterium]|nr:hypothetical protein [Planctomycetales bacterium]
MRNYILVLAVTLEMVLAHASVVRAQNPFLPLQVLDQTVYSGTGNRYLLTSMTDYASAHAFAVEKGGWLWSVNSADEMNGVIDAFLGSIQQYGDSFVAPDGFAALGSWEDLDIYIGLNDSEIYGATEGNFQWINGDPVTYVNWSGGEPNNVGQETDPAGEDYA